MKTIYLSILTVFLASCALAHIPTIVVPDHGSQRLNTLNRSLTVDNFFAAYMGEDIKQRQLAEMYIVGVLDASEGDEWCSYETLSPGGLQEQVLVALKKAKDTNPQQRVSTAIKTRFIEFFPCKDAK